MRTSQILEALRLHEQAKTKLGEAKSHHQIARKNLVQMVRDITLEENLEILRVYDPHTTLEAIPVDKHKNLAFLRSALFPDFALMTQNKAGAHKSSSSIGIHIPGLAFCAKFYIPCWCCTGQWPWPSEQRREQLQQRCKDLRIERVVFRKAEDFLFESERHFDVEGLSPTEFIRFWEYDRLANASVAARGQYDPEIVALIKAWKPVLASDYTGYDDSWKPSKDKVTKEILEL